jgi:hypothetical protein
LHFRRDGPRRSGGQNRIVVPTPAGPAAGVAIAAPVAAVTMMIAAIGTPTFGIFAAGSGMIAESPGANRVFVTFTDSSGASGARLPPPAPAKTAFSAHGVQTYCVFAAATAPIPFAPSTPRVYVQFSDASGAIRGPTAVAVRTK